jgi:N-acetylglucosaminyl-diphospho-decaprenol L-rhamnosyltransferase
MSGAVGVIIVTYNSRPHFARQRAALEAQTIPFRLIVLDNDSKPDQQPKAEDFPAHAEILQMEENTGFARGNNIAMARLDTPLVALLNPDAFPAPDWLETLVAAAAAHPDAASFGSTQIAAEDPDAYDGLGDCYHVFGIPWRGGYGWPLATERKSGIVFSACAAAALYRRDVWRELGGFDERYFAYCEDVDIGFRFWLAGWRVRQVSDAVVHHIGGASSGKRSDFAVYHGTRNRLWTFLKNMPAPAFWLLAPAHAAVTLYLLLRAQTDHTGSATWRGLRDALKGLPDIWKSRAAIQRARKGNPFLAMTTSLKALRARAPVVRNR